MEATEDREPLVVGTSRALPVPWGLSPPPVALQSRSVAAAEEGESLAVSNGDIELSIDPSDGRITKLRSDAADVETDLDHRLLWYR